MAQRLLITGGSGYLGRRLVRRVAAAWPGEWRYTTFSADPLGLPQAVRLDVRDAAAVARLVASFAPDAIVHTAGSNTTPDMATVIVAGTRAVAAAAARAGARLVHLSTDVLLGGDRAPYDESAAPAPVNAYGRAKATAEALALAHPNAVAVRTSLIYGLQEMDNGTAWMAAALRDGQPVTLFTNQRRNPVWVETLVSACLELLDLPYRGVLNVAGQQTLSRAAFALRLLDWWGVSERATLTLAEDHSGRWPVNCALDVSLAARLLRTALPGVDDVLAAASEQSSTQSRQDAQTQ